MSGSSTRRLGIGITIAVIASVVALFNVTPGTTAAAECKGDPGEGGRGTPSGSATPSPSESDDDPLPIPTLPGEEEDSPSATPSSSQPPGGSGSRRCPTNLTISYERSRASSSTVAIKGKVRSPESDCEGARDVTLKKKKSGPDRTVGSTVSRANGAWSIRERNARGRYYAVVAKRKVGSTTCLAGTSRTITL